MGVETAEFSAERDTPRPLLIIAFPEIDLPLFIKEAVFEPAGFAPVCVFPRVVEALLAEVFESVGEEVAGWPPRIACLTSVAERPDCPPP